MSNPKIHEKFFNEYLTKLIYAAFKDIEAEWNGNTRFEHLVYQNYDNLVKDKKDRGERKNCFTIADPVRQFIAFLFNRMMLEVQEVEFLDSDSAESMCKKLCDNNADCYSEFMINLGNSYKPYFGKTLSGATQPTDAKNPAGWLTSQIVGYMHKYAAKPLISAQIDTFVTTFLKAIAWLIAKFIWYCEMTISEKMFLGMIAQQKMSQIMIDEMESCLRPKPVPKPRKPKSGAASPAGTNGPVTQSGNNPDNGNPDNEKSTNDTLGVSTNENLSADETNMLTLLGEI